MLPAPGEEIDLGQRVIGQEFIDRYLSSAEGQLPIYDELGAAPPLALASYVIGELLQKLSLPAGTIHAAQEIDCQRLVMVGDQVSCVAKLSRPVRRGDWRFVYVNFTMYQDNSQVVLEGKTTVLVPTVEADSVQG